MPAEIFPMYTSANNRPQHLPALTEDNLLRAKYAALQRYARWLGFDVEALPRATLKHRLWKFLRRGGDRRLPDVP